jgi:hypothetical protein
MSQRKTFTEADLTKALSDAGSKLERKISGYLIGGCAMTFMGRKVATKDIDILFRSADDAKDFVRAMQLIGFRPVKRLSSRYDALGAFAILENSDEMRFDVFDRQVCKALQLSGSMKERARLYRGFDNLDVYVMSPEDIFLFKGITEREADLDDMRILAEMGLDWPAIEKECLSQRRSGRWAYMLGTKLLELRTKFAITSPIIKTLMDHADLELLTYVFGQVIGEEERPFKEIANAIKEKYKYSDSWTRKQLRILIQRRVARKRRVGRQDIYHMRKFAKRI